MKKSVLYALLLAGLLGFALPVLAGKSIAFGTLVDHLDVRKNTKLHAKEYWRNVEGSEVRWSGVVENVRGGASKAKVYIANKTRPTYKGYNIVVVTLDVPKAANLKKGQHVRFKGMLDGYSAKRAGAVITLSEGEFY